MKKTVKLTSLLLCIMMLVSSVAAVPAFTASAQEPDAVYDWIEPWQIPIASICSEGNLAYWFINDGVTNNTSNTYAGGKAEGYMDYYGYRFVNTYTVDTVVFTSGKKYGDGGYFAEAPVIRVLQDGVWNEVNSQISPDYDAKEYTDYTFTFDPVACDGIMVYGAAGGSKHFISCAELKVRAQIEEKNSLELTRYEFEQYAPDMTAGGKITVQSMSYATTDTKMWSHGYQILWKRAAEDKELSFDFRVMADGEYNVNLLLTAAGDFGSFAYSIDDTQIGGEVSSKADSVMPIRVNELGKIKLTAGIHTFKITALSDADGELLGGFDAFELEKVSDGKWIQYDSTPVASVTRTGAVSLARIADGNYSTFTNLYGTGKTEETLDWIGYTFDNPQTVTELRYTEGKKYSDGGWFREAPVIKVLQNGEWTEIKSEITPLYDASGTAEYPKYSFTFEPVECDGIIVSGKPGGAAKFISCGEIEVRAKVDSGAEEEAPDFFSISASDGVVSANDAGKFNITWNANILINENTNLDEINSKIVCKSYGVYYGVSPESISALIAGTDTQGAKKLAFAEGDDINVYTIFGFRLKNVAESRSRAAMFYVTYEYNGKNYTVYSDCITAETTAQ